MSDLATQLAEARAARHDLVTGKSVVSIEVEGERVQYNQASLKQLDRYIRDLEALAPDSQTRKRRGPVGFIF